MLYLIHLISLLIRLTLSEQISLIFVNDFRCFQLQVTEYPTKNGLKNKNSYCMYKFERRAFWDWPLFLGWISLWFSFPSDTKIVATIPSITSLVTMFKSEKEDSCYSFFLFLKIRSKNFPQSLLANFFSIPLTNSELKDHIFPFRKTRKVNIWLNF